MSAIFFVSAAFTFYFALLIWCFHPLFRKSSTARRSLARPVLGLYLVAVNFIPSLALPLTGLVQLTGQENGAAASIIFPLRTLYNFALNVRDRNRADALVVEVEFPIQIDGIRYSPKTEVACTTRRMQALDLGSPVFFDQFPTIVVISTVQRTGNAFVPIQLPSALCSFISRNSALVTPHTLTNIEIGQLPIALMVRERAGEIELLKFPNVTQPMIVCSIKIDPAQITSVNRSPGKFVAPLSSLWPISRENELHPLGWPRLGALGVETKGCVSFVEAFASKETGKVQLAPKASAAKRGCAATSIEEVLRVIAN